MKNLPNMNMVVLQRSRRKPKAGDLFVCNIRGERWVAGRVIHTDCRMIASEPGCEPLLYFYRLKCAEPARLRPPLEPDLLIPPIVTDPSGWEMGYLKTLGNFPLAAEEQLPRHVFLDWRFADRPDDPRARFVDEFDQPCSPLQAGEYWQRSGAAFLKGIDDMLSDAIGCPRAAAIETATRDLEPSTNGVIVCLPDAEGSLDVLQIEQSLEAALKAASVGEWEGHGYDLERQLWDIRFQGPDPARMSEVMLPVLKQLDLPPNSSLLVGGKEPRRVDL